MDLKKEVRFSKKKPTYPTKRTINLVEQAVPKKNRLLEIGLFCATLVVIAVFAKFLVVDPLMTAARSTDELQAAEAQLSQLKAESSDYSQIRAEHERYVVVGKTEAEQNLVERNDLFDLLETKIAGEANLQSVKVVGNTVAVTCVAVTLQDLSGLVARLEADELVSYVTVSTAASSEKEQSTATINIVLRDALETDEAAISLSDKQAGGNNAK